MKRRGIVTTVVTAVGMAAGLATLGLSCWLLTHPFPYRLSVEQEELLRSVTNALLFTFAAAVILCLLGITLRASRGAWKWAQWIGTGAAVGGFFMASLSDSGVHSAPSELNRCMNTMRRIEGLKAQYAVEHHLGDGTVVTVRELWSGGDAFPQCPGGGAYTIGPVGAVPLCSVHGECE